ncbi:enoyl-CoA hydratase/isomerase family protein [Halorientalis marina]|jgi:enoyl-CoA hydratase|uniref:enoyl-CoA hydratase/isomerase family protein n=1 Tax=Halorientalis marina TaxID=2931976 RepID=UPI001FF55FC0|nr:enoyl-CoA hydratase/isomerase family protein [Halorientalis marina]
MREIGDGNALLDIEGHRADVWLNRPDKRNAMNQQVIADLHAAIDEVAAVREDEDIRAMTLLGKGPVFCAGMDLNLMHEADAAVRDEFSAEANTLIDDIEALPVPTVAGVKASAIAGAFELTLPADFRVIDAEATYGLRETKLGIFPFFGSTQRLPRMIGLSRAKDLVLRSDLVDPEEAERMGLVHEVVEPGTVDEEAKSLADELATRAPLGMARAKECLHAAFDTPVTEGAELEDELVSEIWDTHDRREGFAAALEDREPEFERE